MASNVQGQSACLAMVAGEASGDLLAGTLLGALRQRLPDLNAQGIGGPLMLAHGFEAWWPSQKLAVHGYVEALKAYRELSGIREQLAQRWIASRPDAFIGIDAPDFNFGLEARLKAAGIKTIHFVCPSIWAWRGGRAKKIAASTDHVLCLFPFEPEILARHGVAATFVGHPMADAIPVITPRDAGRQALGFAANDTVVALLPGSRNSEMRYIGPAFLQAAVLLKAQRPELRFVVPVVPAVRAAFDALVKEHAPDLDLTVLDGRSHDAMAACDVTLIASGTATLEAALFKCPMVIAYRMHELNWQILKRMRYQPWIGLPNILLRDMAVPELLQRDASPEALARETLAWLDNPTRTASLQARFTELHHLLRRDTSRVASDVIQEILEKRRA